MRLGTVLSCLWLVVLINVHEGNTHEGKAHKGMLRKGVDSKHMTLRTMAHPKHRTLKKLAHPKHSTLKRRTDLNIGDAADEFHKHCAEIFLDHKLSAYVIHGMMMEVMNKLEELCLEKTIHPLIHKTFTESLLCDESLSVAISKVIDILFGQVHKQCYEKPGFTGIFVFTTIENEIEESKNLQT